MNMPSYKYKDSIIKMSRPSYLYNGNPHIWKDRRCIKDMLWCASGRTEARGFRDPFWYRRIYLFIRSSKFWKTRDWLMKWSNCLGQHWDSRLISEFATSRPWRSYGFVHVCTFTNLVKTSCDYSINCVLAIISEIMKAIVYYWPS